MSTAAQAAQDTVVGLAKVAPAAAVTVSGATGAINWSDVAYALTALYMLLQIVLLIPKYRQWLHDMRAKLKRSDISQKASSSTEEGGDSDSDR